MASEIRFIADCMLGKLSRWLRICGFDTLYFRQVSDPDLLERAKRENRILLTRDRALFDLSRKRSLRAILIAHDLYEEQLKQVFQEADVADIKDQIFQEANIDDHPSALGRCLDCNTVLQKADKAQIETRVPAYIFDTEQEFYVCPACRKVYWRGTHWVEMRRSLKRLLGQKTGGEK
ncbi:MAG: Mut7-C RNAse domain-containing protein [bacterium]